jgi:hypothetical protein
MATRPMMAKGTSFCLSISNLISSRYTFEVSRPWFIAQLEQQVKGVRGGKNVWGFGGMGVRG